MKNVAKCPACFNPVHWDWEWCHTCGYDPDGLNPEGGGPSPPPSGAKRPPPETAERHESFDWSPDKLYGAAPPPSPGPWPGARAEPERTAYPPLLSPTKPVDDKAIPSFGPDAPTHVSTVGPYEPPGWHKPTVRERIFGPVGIVCAVLLALILGGIFIVRPLLSRDEPPVTTPKIGSRPPAIMDGTTPGWKKVTPADSSFSIELPGTPAVAPTDMVVGPNQFSGQTYTSAVFNDSYSATVLVAPTVDPADPQAALNAYVDTAAAAVQGKVEARIARSHGGQPAIQYTITLPDGKGSILGRAVAAGDHLFIVQLSAPSPDQGTWDRLMTNFQILMTNR